MANDSELYSIDISVPQTAPLTFSNTLGGSRVGQDESDDQRVRDLAEPYVSPLTKKGDIFVFGQGNASSKGQGDTRLPIGADTFVLTADSTQLQGMKWAPTSTLKNLMNVDYVVDSNGHGTHTSIYGASGVLAQCITDAANRVVWVCSTHVEPTVTTEQVMNGLATNQTIVIMSGGPWRPNINVNLTGEFHKQTNASPNVGGGGWVLRYQGLSFTRTGGTPDFYGAQNGISAVQLQFIDCSFPGNWGTMFNGNLTGSCTFSGMLFERCRGDGGSGVIDSMITLSSAGAGSGSFVMRDCYEMNVNYVAKRVNSTDFDPATSVDIYDNIISVAQYLWQKTYNTCKLKIQGNEFTHSGAVDFIKLGTNGSTDTSDSVVTDNNYIGTAGGQTFVHFNPAAGAVKNTIVSDNNIHGPGSGTAIQIDALAEADVIIDNAYVGWGTNVGGDGWAWTLLGDTPHQWHAATSTTDNVQKTIQTFKISRSRTTLVRTIVTARRTGGSAGASGDGAGYVITSAYSNEAFAAVLIGAVSADFTAENQAGWDATHTVSGENVLVRVTGATNNNIDWQAVTTIYTVG